MNQNLQDTVKRFLSVFTVFLVILSAFLVVWFLKGGAGDRQYDTISVSADAETFASPDIAEISFVVRSEDKEMAKAQADVESKIIPVLSAIKDIGIEEKDVKTTYYNANPRYEYGRNVCLEYRCDSNQRALVGYEVNQSMSIMVRDLDNVGKALAALGANNVSDIYGPNFRVENEDSLKAEVREEAIAKAKEKGKALAKSLGVRIVGIENFSEGYGGGIYYAKSEMMGMADAVMSAPTANVTLPQGENKIQTTVNIVYRVR